MPEIFRKFLDQLGHFCTIFKNGLDIFLQKKKMEEMRPPFLEILKKIVIFF